MPYSNKMNVRLVFLTFGLFLASSCASFKTIQKTYDHSSSVSFTIDKIKEGKSYGYATVTYVAEKGSKLVYVHMTFNNHSKSTKGIHLQQFKLEDNRSSHLLKFVVSGGLYLELEGGSSAKRTLVYVMAESESAKALLFEEKTYPIEYQE